MPAGHSDLSARGVVACFDRQLNATSIDGFDMLTETGWFQHLTRRAERVGDDHFCPGVNVVSVHFPHDVLVAQHSRTAPCNLVHRYTAALKFRPEGAVDDEERRLADAIPEVF